VAAHGRADRGGLPGPALSCLVAAGSVSITPDRPLPLAGFTGRLEPLTAVADPLELNALLLRTREATLAILTADLLFVSAEPVAEYGLAVRAPASREEVVIPVGYTDSVFGYLPTARMLGQHGYEDEGFMDSFGITGRFRPDLEQVVQRTWDGLRERSGATRHRR
jgi:hypothetical protein